VSMSPETREEYRVALRAATLRHGTLVDRNPSVYGYIADDWEHAARCELSSGAVPEEVEWSQFQDTFAPNKTYHGISLSGVNCACGTLVNREVRWEADVSEMTEAVFEHVFARLTALETRKREDNE
jgi:hypothetical protein